MGPTVSDNSALLPMFRLKIRSARMLDTIVCSGPLVEFGLAVLSEFPAWDGLELTPDIGLMGSDAALDSSALSW
jgi:hypothetical protein